MKLSNKLQMIAMGSILVGTGVVIACARDATSIAGPSLPMMELAQARRTNPAFAPEKAGRRASIKARVAAIQSRGITSREKAHASELKRSARFPAELHNVAMREVLADKAAWRMRNGAENQYCDRSVRLMTKHALAMGRRSADVAGDIRKAAIAAGVCPSTGVSSIFGAPVPVVPTVGTVVQSTTLSTGFIDYLGALTEDVGDTPSAAAAYAVSAAYVIAASEDGALLPGDITVIAAAAALSDESVSQWQYTESLFLWGWISKAVRVVKADLGGCATAATLSFLFAIGNQFEGYGSDDALNACAYGAGPASIAAWGAIGSGGEGGGGGGEI